MCRADCFLMKLGSFNVCSEMLQMFNWSVVAAAIFSAAKKQQHQSHQKTKRADREGWVCSLCSTWTITHIHYMSS